ncbi:MAG: phenylalanine--tRNA ligase subunit beta [Desulfobacterales bacterium]|nr:MAG: phenylalanine--tRNA ligase subunit beta [Desulfobacterales bacterium]
MRVPLLWLRDYVDVDLSVNEVADLLTNAGLEVKETILFGIPGADLEWDREKILLSHILRVEKHPDADRLVLAMVDYGAAEPKTVVTGAPNLFQYIGQGDIGSQKLYSPLALEGSVLYDGHKEGGAKLKLRGRELRGIYNDAMLCSEKELGISDDHEGIIIMERDAWSPEYRTGVPMQDLLGDAVLEIDIIPNIARCASIVGVAREYAALTNQPLRYPDYEVIMEGPDTADRVRLTTDRPDLNPRFVGMIITGVEQKPSPYWMQYRLRLAGQRPINVVVDISNYVMLEMGQPTHCFDFDFLRQRADEYDPQGPIHIHTRLPEAGETLTTLDGIEHKLPEFTILVTDPIGNLSIGGIMGGENSEIKPETTNVLLEGAAWNFINIRKSATQMGFQTDAAFRFSRGVHPSQALLGTKRAAELMRRLAGSTVAKGVIDYYPNPPEPVRVELDPDYACCLSGLDLSLDEMAALLRRLEFEVTVTADRLTIIAPDHRMDIEGPHDLVEEICRMYGYDNIPSTVMADTLPPQRGNPELEREEAVRDIMVQMGLQEVISYRLTSIEREAKLIAADDAAATSGRDYITITNPISTDRCVMRRSLLSSVLEAGASNSRYQHQIAIFEIGDIYLPQAGAELPKEWTRLAVLMTGRRHPHFWQDGKGAEAMDFFDLKGVLESLFAKLHLPVRFIGTDHPTFRPGRAAKVMLGNKALGVLGELHPAVKEGYDLRIEVEQAVLAADLDLQSILAEVPESYAYEPVSVYPAIHEDLALVVDQHLQAAEIEEALYNFGGILLKKVAHFDFYDGEQIPKGKKSLAYHLIFQAPNRTLTDKDVMKLRERIIQKMAQKYGAKLRE